MAQRIGIADHTQQRIIGGARVAFDSRITAEVNDTRDMTNRRTLEQPMREVAWRDRQRAKKGGE